MNLNEYAYISLGHCILLVTFSMNLEWILRRIMVELQQQHQKHTTEL